MSWHSYPSFQPERLVFDCFSSWEEG